MGAAVPVVQSLTACSPTGRLLINAATGTRRWVARYYGLGVSGPLSMAISRDGSRLFVAGFTTPPGSALPACFAVVAYDASTGAMLWARHPFSDGLTTSVTVSPDSATV